MIVATSIGACKGRDDSAATGTPKPATTTAAEPAPPAAGAAWDAFVTELIEAALADDPGMAVVEGRHEHDGKVIDLSAAAIEARVARLEAARARAEAFDEATLTEAQRFERRHVIATLDGQLFWIRDAAWLTRSPFAYMEAIDPDVYLTRDYAPLAQRMKAVIELAGHVPAVAANARANLRTPMPRTYAALGQQMFRGMASFYAEDIPRVFASVGDAAGVQQLAAATQKASQALRELTAFFDEQLAAGTGDYAIGAELFAKMLAATERVTTPLSELQEIGEADLARNLDALTAACAEVAPKKPIADCIARVASDKPEEGPVLRARAQLDELEAFLRGKDLVTIPGPERATVEEAPPYNRWNAAYISTPGPFEDRKIEAVYYIAPPDPSWSRAEQLQYIPSEADLLFISVHEVWPGHFLHSLHRNRVKSRIAQLFGSYAYGEGWAHYTEELMWEAGLSAGDPKARVGQLLNALLRNVRYVCAIGLHTAGMTVDQCEAMFRDKAFQDPGNARQQAARGTFDPGYLNYTLGKLMIRRLRQDWTESRGGEAAWKAFHDALLSYGGAPLPLVRADMLKGTPGASGPLL